MLGQALYKILSERGYDVYGVGRTEGDIIFDLQNDERLLRCVRDIKPDIIINSAGVIDVNLCEGDHGSAYSMNARLPSVLSEISSVHNIYLVQVSTDHYYAEDGKTKHDEDYPIKLINEYGRTKYIGEQMSMLWDKTIVLRTNIVGFRNRKKDTFLEWVIKEINSERKITLFTDFYTSSMHVNDFAIVLCDLLKIKPNGIYNLASSEINNKKDFVLALCKGLFNRIPNYNEGTVKKINGAPRGDSLGLDTGKIESLLGYKMPTLEQTIESIKKEYLERYR